VDRLRERLKEFNAGSMLVTNMTNVRYLTGFTGSSGQAVVTPTETIFITDSRYAIQASDEAAGWDQRIFSAPTKGMDFLKDTLASARVTELAFESEYVTVSTYDQWKDKLAAIDLKPIASPVDKLRMIKDEGEIDAIRRACALTDACLHHVLPKVQANVTEMDLALEMDFYFRRQGAEPGFGTHVVSGARSAMPHGMPSDKRIENGDFVTFDFGARVDGYNADMTRTIVVGEASDRHREIYEAVLEALEVSKAAIRPGVMGPEIDKLSRDTLAKRNLAQYFGHGLGHGLGLNVHDGGDFRQDMKLEAGMVMTVEPGVYIEGFGGCRIEDDVVIRDGGVEVLNTFPRELMIV